MRLSSLSAALMGGAAFIFAVASPADAQTPKRGGVLVHGITQDPANLDCHQSNVIFLAGIVKPVLSTLVKYDQNNYPNVVGDLAESWTVAPDGLTYTFKLRPNVKFHDGSVFSSADVLASFERIKNPQGFPSVRRADFADVTFSAPDANTMVFKLPTPNVAMLELIANPLNCIYSARRLQADQKSPEKEAIGTGAFQLVSYQAGAEAVGKRFDGYFRPGLPYLDGYKAVVINSPQQPAAFAAGQLDAVFRAFSPQEIDVARAQLGDKFVIDAQPLSLLPFTVFNVQRKPFDDVRVRKALTLAIDRWGGIEGMKKISTQLAVGGMLRPGYEYARTNAELEKFPGYGRNLEANRAEARRLLAEAGQTNLSLKLLNLPTGQYALLGQFVIPQWTAIGVKAEQDVVQGANYQQRQNARDFDVTLDTNVSSSDDPTIMLVKYTPGAGANFSGYTDQTLTDLFNKQKVTFDKAARKQLVNAFEARMLDEQAYIAPLFWPGHFPPVRTYVHGWKTTPNYNMGYELTEVWMDK